MTLVKTGGGMLRFRWAILAVSLILGPMSIPEKRWQQQLEPDQ